MTANEHEIAIACLPPNTRLSGHLLDCSECDRLFRTTDWWPALCPECRSGAATANPEQQGEAAP